MDEVSDHVDPAMDADSSSSKMFAIVRKIGVVLLQMFVPSVSKLFEV